MNAINGGSGITLTDTDCMSDGAECNSQAFTCNSMANVCNTKTVTGTAVPTCGTGMTQPASMCDIPTGCSGFSGSYWTNSPDGGADCCL